MAPGFVSFGLFGPTHTSSDLTVQVHSNRRSPAREHGDRSFCVHLEMVFTRKLNFLEGAKMVWNRTTNVTPHALQTTLGDKTMVPILLAMVLAVSSDALRKLEETFAKPVVITCRGIAMMMGVVLVFRDV